MQRYRANKRLRLLQEEKELRMTHQHIIVRRPVENEHKQEDDVECMLVNALPDNCTDHVADVIRPVEPAEAVGHMGNITTDRKLTVDDVDVLINQIKVVANRHKLSHSCINVGRCGHLESQETEQRIKLSRCGQF